MKKQVFFLSVIVSFLLFSCSQTQHIIYQPSFLAVNGLPDKPSFNNKEFTDFYYEGYNSLKALNNTIPSSGSTTNKLKISQYLVPAFSLSLTYGNYFNEYSNFCYLNPNYIGVNNNYLYPSLSSGFYNGYYYSQYSHGWYWGTFPTGTGDGTQDFNYPKQNFSNIDPFQQMGISQQETNQSWTNPNKIIYAKPVEKSKKSTKVRINFNYNEVYNYTSKEKSINQNGYYRSPKSAPAVYAYPSNSGAPRSNWQSNKYAPKPSYNSSTSGYSPPKSSGNANGGSSSGSGYTPKQNNASSGAATPKK